MNTIKKNKALLNEIDFYEVIICYIKKNNLIRIEEILKWIVFFEEVILSKGNINDILIKLIEYFFNDKKNKNSKSFDRILKILFENKIFNPNFDFENIIKVCIKNRKIYLINKIIISIKNYLPKEIIKNINFGKILLELFNNLDVTYDIFHLIWNLIFHNEKINLDQFKFDEIIISATGNNIIGKQIIQGLLVNLINFDNSNFLINLEQQITTMYEKDKIDEKYYKIINRNLKLNKNKNKNKN